MSCNASMSARGQDWPRLIGLALASSQGAVVFVVAARALVGALTAALAPLTACVVMTISLAAGLAAYACLQRTSRRSWRDWRRSALTAVSFVPALVLSLIIIPPDSTGVIAAATVMFVFAAAAVWAFEERLWDDRALLAASRDEPSASSLPAHTLRVSEPTSPDAANVLQWMTRTRPSDGSEAIEGGMRVTFEAGQRQQALHIALCPPLPGVPEVECEVLDEADVLVNVAAARPYGLRLEARRDGDMTLPLTTEIGFVAACDSVPQAAAA